MNFKLYVSFVSSVLAYKTIAISTQGFISPSARQVLHQAAEHHLILQTEVL
jgi:hypothetical protein